MKKQNFILSVCFMLFVHYVVARNPVLIGLGQDCEVAQQLRKHNLRNEAYPFDWNQTFDFDGVIKMLADDFQYVLDVSYLVNKGVYIKNVYYDLNFIHDFPNMAVAEAKTDDEISYVAPILANFLDSLSIVKGKYTRRITRLKNILLGDNPVVFFRIQATPIQAQKFVDLMAQKYSSLKFLLVVLHENKALDYDWQIANVKNFYLSEKLVPGLPADHLLKDWWSDHEWKHVLRKLKLIQ